MAKGFLVQSVGIEGFKGFTTRKEIAFNGRHVFLLGRNGNGKSSVIEAVRWGLFGSARRPNEIVANRGYVGRCRVEITLINEGQKWHLRRTLNRGTTGGSDAVLTDEHSREHSIQEIMPQLDSVDAGEGMHIIFAPQATPLRRQPEDLSAFERTVFNHLGLTHPRALLAHIENLIDGQELTERDLGQKLTDTRNEIDTEIERLERLRGNIVSAPPWESERPPLIAQSENKVRALITEITGEKPDESLSGLSLDALIDNAEDALNERRSQDQTGLEDQELEVESRKTRLDDLSDILKTIKAREQEAQRIQENLDGVLQGISIDDLRNIIADTKAKADVIALQRQIVDAAVELLSREEGGAITCYTCGAGHTRQDFEGALHDLDAQLSGSAPPDLADLENRRRLAEAYDAQSQDILGAIADLKRAEDEAKNYIRSEDGEDALPEHVGIATLAEAITRHSERVSSIRAQIDGQESWFAEKRAQLSKMREEERFHQIQRDLERRRQSKNRFARIETAYANLVSFGGSVREIRQAVSSGLNDQLAKDLPRVSERLSQVFNGLTNHPWYDRLTIARDPMTKLELRVSSSQEPASEHPTGVLNGQSESALALVPYFAFGQADDAPTEVYLVLLDDPTRAFDEEHISILVERLADLGSNVQLMVASQETGRFRELLPKNFEPASYVVVEPTNWTHHDGPDLDVANG